MTETKQEKYLKKHPDRRKKTVHEYYLRNREKIMEKQRIWRKQNPKKLKAQIDRNNKKYRERHKEKNKIRKMASHYLRKKMLERDSFKCQDCGTEDNLEMHELKYTREWSVDNVITLCRKCHSKRHRKF